MISRHLFHTTHQICIFLPEIILSLFFIIIIIIRGIYLCMFIFISSAAAAGAGAAVALQANNQKKVNFQENGAISRLCF